ncbi:GFA family protein [Neptuniibacter sp. QD57_21]|uniref:GFA family protein n=1 Tax=Neptuniibacter sp. QD57_21 TaxID=3398213 RepID=UPI0039F64810
MPVYQGSCHCGNVRFSFHAPEIVEGVRCNCSICQKKGAMMGNFVVDPSDIDIQVSDDSLATYEFATHIAKHHFCKQCGIYTFHQTLRKPGHYRVHLGCVDGVDVLALPYELIDDASL